MAKTAGEFEILGGAAALFGAWAGHWLITPMAHPDANSLQYGAAWVQFAGGWTYGIWALRRARHLKATDEAGPAGPTYRLLGLGAALLAGLAGHWLITPMAHPNPTGLETLAAWTQLLAGSAYAAWAYRRARHDDRSTVAV